MRVALEVSEKRKSDLFSFFFLIERLKAKDIPPELVYRDEGKDLLSAARTSFHLSSNWWFCLISRLIVMRTKQTMYAFKFSISLSEFSSDSFHFISFSWPEILSLKCSNFYVFISFLSLPAPPPFSRPLLGNVSREHSFNFSYSANERWINLIENMKLSTCD